MNLVQISERLKGLPIPVLKQYANGMNPDVPSYVALGELQRRELQDKKMAAAQGAMQGEQPSVKEQIEQKAGLMALQQMQQQQMAQQQTQPRGPMPAPAGVAQPEPQPEVMMAASGGLARIPVRNDMFDYAGGGIVAFANGGDTMGTPSFEQQELASKASEMAINERSKAKLIAELEQKLSFLINAESPKAAEVSAQLEAVKASGATSLPKPTPAAARPAAPASVSEAQATMKAGPQAAVPVSGVKAAADVKGPPRPPAAGPAAPQSGLPTALPARSPYFAQVNADLAKEIPKPTTQEIIAEQKALSPEAMQEEFMKKRSEEQRQRAAGERAAFEKSRPSGLDDLIRVFGQAGQYKGLSGLAPAYTANQQQRRNEELAMEQRQNELLTNVDKREYEGGKELFGARTTAMKDANKSFQDRVKSRSEVLAQMAGVDQRSIDEALNRQTQVQLQGMRDAAAKLERTSPGKAERMLAEVLALRAAGKNKEADMIIETINAIEGRAGKEDTFTKKIEAERVRIAGSMLTPDMKKKALDDLNALEKRGSGSGGNSSGVIDKNNPLLK